MWLKSVQQSVSIVQMSYLAQCLKGKVFRFWNHPNIGCCLNKNVLGVWSKSVQQSVSIVQMSYLVQCLEEKVFRVPREVLSFMAAEPFIKPLKFCAR